MSAPAVAVRQRPIPFDAESVRGILADGKTQSRRVILPHPELRDGALYWRSPRFDNGAGVNYFHTSGEISLSMREAWARACPYGRAGDRLWVRERWAVGACADDFRPRELDPKTWRGDNGGLWYASDGAEPRSPISPRGRWRAARFMPRWASRMLLELTEVRVQRLKEMTLGDVAAEGWPDAPKEKLISLPELLTIDVLGFGWMRERWDALNAKRGYPAESNPWVWALTFRRVTP